MAITTEVGIHHIQKQVDNCDTIVANIDKIVPKLYKIRQQVLAQKEYINDINRKLLTDGLTSVDANSILTIKTSQLDSTLVASDWAGSGDLFKGDAGVTNNTVKQRQLFQSLFKYKHEIGTPNHFTTEQIGTSTDRTSGPNLSDVVKITSGLNDLVKVSSTTPATLSDSIKNLFLKQGQASVVPLSGTTALVHTSAATANTYKNDATEGIESLLIPAAALTDSIIGFGLND